MNAKHIDLLFQIKDISNSEKFILVFLIMRADDEKAECWPSYNTIATATSLCRRKVIYDIKRLINRQIIRVTTKKIDYQMNKSNVYKVNIGRLKALANTNLPSAPHAPDNAPYAPIAPPPSAPHALSLVHHMHPNISIEYKTLKHLLFDTPKTAHTNYDCEQKSVKAEPKPPEQKLVKAEPKPPPVKKYKFQPSHFELAERMATMTLRDFPNAKIKLEQWADAIRKLVEIDQHNENEILTLWIFIRNHDSGSFSWSDNCRTPMKLRQRKEGISYFDIINKQRERSAEKRNSDAEWERYITGDLRNDW